MGSLIAEKSAERRPFSFFKHFSSVKNGPLESENLSVSLVTDVWFSTQPLSEVVREP